MFQLPNEFRWARIDAPELPRRVRSATALQRALDALRAKRTILLGDTGTGKTSLGCAIGRAIMQGRDVNGMFVSALALDKARRQAALGRGEADLVQRAFEVPVLVLDELGAEDGASGTLKEILQERHASARQTIVACVLSVEGLRRHYDGGIVRRLFEGALPIACGADNQPTPKSEVRMVSLRRPWREEAPTTTVEPVAMPPELREALERSLARVGLGGSDVSRRPLPPPLEVDDGALAERRALLRIQAAALVAAEPQPEPGDGEQETGS